MAFPLTFEAPPLVRKTPKESLARDEQGGGGGGGCSLHFEEFLLSCSLSSVLHEN